MSTYADLQDRISLDYLNRTDLLPEVKRAIKNAIRTHESSRYWFNEASTAIAASSGQTFITIPADFLSLDRVEITQSSQDYKLSQRDFNWLRDMRVARTQGLPTDFNYYRDRLELFPIPDSAYSIIVYYVASLATLSADSDTNAWTNEASNLIAHEATVDLLANVVQASPDRIQRQALLRSLALQELQSRNYSRISFRLKPTAF